MTFWILWILIAPIIWLIMPTRIIGKKYLKTLKIFFILLTKQTLK